MKPILYTLILCCTLALTGCPSPEPECSYDPATIKCSDIINPSQLEDILGMKMVEGNSCVYADDEGVDLDTDSSAGEYDVFLDEQIMIRIWEGGSCGYNHGVQIYEDNLFGPVNEVNIIGQSSYELDLVAAEIAWVSQSGKYSIQITAQGELLVWHKDANGDRVIEWDKLYEIAHIIEDAVGK